jgi:hypothetical protein
MRRGLEIVLKGEVESPLRTDTILVLLVVFYMLTILALRVFL